MTDTLTRPAPVQVPEKSGRGSLTTKRVVILGLFIGVLVGLGAFAVVGGPSRADLQQAHWGQVVDYYSDQHQLMTDAGAAAEAAHWEEVVNHYARQYELMSNAPTAPASDSQAAYWQAVVDYYGQQWEMRTK